MSRFRVILLGVLAVFAASAFASASASAGPLHWYECLKHGGKTLLYIDNKCQTHETGKGEWEILKTPEGVSLLIDSLGGLQVLTGVAAGVNIKIECGHLDDEGTIVNPVGGGAGTTSVSLLYLGCTVAPAALKCEIPEKMVSAKPVGVLEGTEAAPIVKFTPEPPGEIFVEIKFEKCTNEGLNTTFKVQGSALGKPNNANSSISVKEEKEKASMLKFAGNEAGLTGEDEVLIAASGGAIFVKE